MKMLKRAVALLAAAAMMLSLGACGKSEESDMAYVKNKGKLVVGITDFAPMDYMDENGNWIGFDADLARAFGEHLGVEVVFSQIEWGNKVFELNGKSLDCAWNGMTLTDEVVSSMACSKPYCKNAQVVILPKDKAEQYPTLESMADLRFAVEAESAGQEQAELNNLQFTPVLAQPDALMEVAAGTCDAAIIDLLMAGAMTGEGTGYANLTSTISLNSEQYGVGFRKGSDLAEELNRFLKTAYDDGTIMKLAETYKITDAILAQ